MIVGFNHNILYKGVGFHVQTEDGGLKSPSLVTLLYHGGIIVSSQKTSYADILGVDNLNQVVEDLAKEQHKGMLRRLTKGEFDSRIFELGIDIGAGSDEPQPGEGTVAEGAGAVTVTEVVEPLDSAVESPEETSGEALEVVEPLLSEEIEELEPLSLEEDSSEDDTAAAAVAPEREAVADSAAQTPVTPAAPVAIEPAFEPPSAEERNPALDVSAALDDLIFSYLTGGNEPS